MMMVGIGLSPHFIPALPTAKVAFLRVFFILSPFLVVHCSIPDFVRTVLRLPSSTLRPRSLSSVCYVPIDADSFPDVDSSRAEITVPRRDDDGRSSAVGTSLGCPMEFLALILYTQREPVIVALQRCLELLPFSPPPNTFEHWSRPKHIPQPTPLHQSDARYP